jgi:hypothetical protein
MTIDSEEVRVVKIIEFFEGFIESILIKYNKLIVSDNWQGDENEFVEIVIWNVSARRSMDGIGE